MLAPLPYPHPNQMVVVWTKIRGERSGTSAADYLAYKKQSRSFADLIFNGWKELHLTSRNGSVEPIICGPNTWVKK